MVISSAFLVSATNVAAGKGTNGFLFGYLDSEETPTANNGKISGQTNKKNDLALVPLAKQNTAVDPEMKEDDTIQSVSQGQGIVALSASNANAMRDPEEDGGVKMYTVQQGDTLSVIAEKNKVSVNTILWANDIDNVDSIMPGDTIFILPVSGIQYVVKKGDTIDSIAAKYKGSKDKIIAFNDLPANGELEEGKTIVVPDGQGETAQPKPATETDNTGGLQRRQYANEAGGAPQVSSGWKDKSDDAGKAGNGHKFPYGWCTWYVAQKRYVPWGGNAGTWLYHAKAQGYRTGKTPTPGSIMVSTENRYYGHVALVEKVSGDTITISEMNYVGWGKVSRRTISASSRAIKGFIY